MKHTLTLRPLLLALLLACLPQWAKAYDSYDFTVDGIYYTITSSTDRTVAVQYNTSPNPNQRRNKYSGDVVIPSTVIYNETVYTVTSISAYEFYGSTGLTSITIPSSVESIGEYAFYECTGLTSLTLPESIVSIESSAFRGCTGLTNLTLNEGLTSIESYVFYGCTGLTSLTLPESMVGIGDYAFYNCTGLTSLTLNEGLTVIGSYAFRSCTGLTSLTIPSTVETIYGYAFGISSSSTALTSVTILGPTYSAAYAFQYQQGLTSITVNVGALTDDECTYYSLSGQRIPAPVKGQTCIIRFSNGTSMKVLVK